MYLAPNPAVSNICALNQVQACVIEYNDPIIWRQVEGPGFTEPETGIWTWDPATCEEVGEYRVVLEACISDDICGTVVLPVCITNAAPSIESSTGGPEGLFAGPFWNFAASCLPAVMCHDAAKRRFSRDVSGQSKLSRVKRDGRLKLRTVVGLGQRLQSEHSIDHFA